MSPEKLQDCILTGDEIFNCEPLPPYVVNKIFGKGDRVLIHAPKGVGKSLTAMSLACSLTTGTPWLDTYEVNGKQHVLWLLGESTQNRFAERLSKMAKCVPFDKDYMHFYKCKRKRFNVDEEFIKFMKVLADSGKKIDVIVLDSLYNFVKGDKNKDETASDWMANVDVMLDMFDCSLIALGHMGKEVFFQKEGGGTEKINKGHSAKGAVEWDAAFTIIYELKVLDKKKFLLKLINHKDRDGECISELTYKMIVPQKDKQGRLMAISNETLGSNNGMLSSYLRHENIELSPHDIMEALNMSESSFHYAARTCLKEGTITKLQDEHGRLVYKTLLK